MPRISIEQLHASIQAAFLNAGMAPQDAETCARIHTETTADGVPSHGILRVPRFVEYIRKGYVDVHAKPAAIKQVGALEVWEGMRGPGVLNALHATERAMAAAAEHGIGLVGLRNTNHWMRGGTYGWLAAERGFVLIAWTNTESCMPAWGGKDPRLGNNPFVMAAPRQAGAVVLDMAMSQYSYGKLQVTRLKGERLPSPGGFDREGNLTDDPGAIEQSQRILPMGMWKGSGFALMLDLLGAVLSQGSSTSGIDALEAGSCVGCSQVFLAVDPRKLGGAEAANGIANGVIDYVHASVADEHGRAAEYPGEGALRRREQSHRDGIEVNESVWVELQKLATT